MKAFAHTYFLHCLMWRLGPYFEKEQSRIKKYGNPMRSTYNDSWCQRIDYFYVYSHVRPKSNKNIFQHEWCLFKFALQWMTRGIKQKEILAYTFTQWKVWIEKWKYYQSETLLNRIVSYINIEILVYFYPFFHSPNHFRPNINWFSSNFIVLQCNLCTIRLNIFA